MQNTFSSFNGGTSSSFNPNGFLDKALAFAKQAGKEVIGKALELYYALDNPKLPASARATIYGALAYLVSPIDVIPDLTPILGFSDDMAVLTLAVVQVARYIDDEVRAKAAATLRRWFG